MENISEQKEILNALPGTPDSSTPPGKVTACRERMESYSQDQRQELAKEVENTFNGVGRANEGVISGGVFSTPEKSLEQVYEDNLWENLIDGGHNKALQAVYNLGRNHQIIPTEIMDIIEAQKAKLREANEAADMLNVALVDALCALESHPAGLGLTKGLVKQALALHNARKEAK